MRIPRSIARRLTANLDSVVRAHRPCAGKSFLTVCTTSLSSLGGSRASRLPLSQRPSPLFLFLGPGLRLALTAVDPAGALGAELKPETVAAFERYVQVTEARIDAELAGPEPFLYLDRQPRPRRDQILETIKGGQVYMQALETRGPDRGEIPIPDGMVHHWYGAIFIPGATLDQVLKLVQDYDHHHEIYRPEVLGSRLLQRDGDDFKVYLRLRKKKVITVTLNTEHDVQYHRVDAQRAHSRSHSTRIAEVEHADQPDEREKPIGHDGGFLWRLDSYWRFEERDGGVYEESESVSLTRGIPFAFNWLIRPFVTGIPRESLRSALGSTRSAILARISHDGT